VLPDGKMQHNFLQKWCNLHACVHERRKEFFQGGGNSGFFQVFLGGKSGEICFLPLETKETGFLLKISNSCPSPGTHACVSEKVRATPLKSSVILSVLKPF